MVLSVVFFFRLLLLFPLRIFSYSFWIVEIENVINLYCFHLKNNGHIQELWLSKHYREENKPRHYTTRYRSNVFNIIAGSDV